MASWYFAGCNETCGSSWYSEFLELDRVRIMRKRWLHQWWGIWPHQVPEFSESQPLESSKEEQPPSTVHGRSDFRGSQQVQERADGSRDCTDSEGVKFKRELTTPYNLQLNGVAEWKNRSIVEATKATIHD
jgi:hypothetical protein